MFLNKNAHNLRGRLSFRGPECPCSTDNSDARRAWVRRLSGSSDHIWIFDPIRTKFGADFGADDHFGAVWTFVTRENDWHARQDSNLLPSA